MFDNWGTGEVVKASVNKTIDVVVNNLANTTNSTAPKVVTYTYPDVFNYLYYLAVIVIIVFVISIFISFLNMVYDITKR